MHILFHPPSAIPKWAEYCALQWQAVLQEVLYKAAGAARHTSTLHVGLTLLPNAAPQHTYCLHNSAVKALSSVRQCKQHTAADSMLNSRLLLHLLHSCSVPL
jgi:hypothetical protein